MRTRHYKLNSGKTHTEAFSLVEILVAVGLLAFIIVGLLAMFYQTQRAFRSSATQTDVLEAGRAVMQMLRQDLQDLHGTDSTNVIDFVCVDPGVPQAVIVDLPPQSGGGGTLSFTNYDLSFLKRLNDVWAAVAYRVDGGSTGVGALYRRENLMDSLDTFDPYSDVAGYPDGLVTASIKNANAKVTDNDFHRVIDGVVQFTVTPYDTNGLPYGNNFAISGRPGYLFASNSVPGFVEIELGVLEPKAVEQVRAKPNAIAAQTYLRDHANRVHLFKQRIVIRTRS